jgi:probable phosphoglycerate mutase
MAVILLVRHGENEWVKKGRLAGWIPGVHLNERGKEQAVNAAARLAHLPITAVYSSPVARCLETARPIADIFDLPITPVEAVGEVHYGKWEGKKIKKLAKKPAWYIVQHFPSRHQFPGGESLREVQNRAVTALEQLSQRHNEEIIVVVSHADVIKLLLAHYLGIHLDLFQRIGLSPASVSAIDLNPKGLVRVLRVNDDGPLQLSQPKTKDEPKTASVSDEEE